jgi:hypothetical protein
MSNAPFRAAANPQTVATDRHALSADAQHRRQFGSVLLPSIAHGDRAQVFVRPSMRRRWRSLRARRTTITPRQRFFDGVTSYVYVKDPTTVAGYSDLIRSFNVLRITPQVHVDSDVPPNEVRIIIGH